ncbi:hypothetical protein DSO57_1012907 [Entomophthora muscae]|uniref:Uncharacterized protein n=1 Tax=Entomophthora muscae TaxID=34485 RepID=A0ACC2SIP0_9FUNG|nr:hypothetical protein DSO57_1012907 [Entomophthora muscae]
MSDQSYTRPDLRIGRNRIPGQKMRPLSMIIINERAKDLEQARLKLQKQQESDNEDSSEKSTHLG